MNCPWGKSFGHLRRENHRATVVEGADKIILADSTKSGIFRVETDDPIVAPVDKDSMVPDVIGPRTLAIVHGVKRETRVDLTP